MFATLPLVSLLSLHLFKPFVEPLKVGALPQYAVLRAQYPVVLVGVDEELRGYTTKDSGIEGGHALRCKDTEIFLSVDAEDGCIPLVYEKVG